MLQPVAVLPVEGGRLADAFRLRDAEVLPYLLPVPYHRCKTHERHTAIILIQTALGSSHQVAAESCELCFGITLPDLFDQCGSVLVSRCLARYQKILHP